MEKEETMMRKNIYNILLNVALQFQIQKRKLSIFRFYEQFNDL